MAGKEHAPPQLEESPPRSVVAREVESNEERLARQAKELGLELLSLEDTKKEAARLLLAGWRMLAELCPITEYPLFEKDGKLWSVRLGMPAGRAQGPHTLPGLTSQPALSSQTQQGNLNLAGEEDEEEQDHSGDGMEQVVDFSEPTPTATGALGKSAEAIASNPDAISHRIGEKLMLGWTMLEEACPVTHACPLMRDPRSGRLWSPALNDYVNEDKGSSARTAKADSGSQQPAPPQRQEAYALPADAPERKAISKRIQERLLQGWTMTGVSCPQTGLCPLMQEPDSGRMYSAALDAFVEGSSSAVKPRTPTAISTAPPQRTAGGAAAAVSRGGNSHFPASSANSRAPEPGASALFARVSAVLDKKMRTWCDELEATEDVRESREFVALLRESVALVRELQDHP